MLQQRARFFEKFVHSPRMIGSVTPSSVFLVRAMLAPIPWHSIQTIVELGAGTGVMTRGIRRQLAPSGTALLFEQDAEMCSLLRQSYPEWIVEPTAERLAEALTSYGIQQVDCIVSGLPFANFTQYTRQEILANVLQALKPGGLFIAFQYSLQMKKQFCAHFDPISITFVPLNVPPAFVYVCRQRG
ncbi:MAG TPA: methyltransferase domain-containing protein [Ktedonobacterales bacterium]|jgi:phospholipid N-methyltransferase